MSDALDELMSITGLSHEQGSALLDAVDGDMATAVRLHFDDFEQLQDDSLDAVAEPKHGPPPGFNIWNATTGEWEPEDDTLEVPVRHFRRGTREGTVEERKKQRYAHAQTMELRLRELLDRINAASIGVLPSALGMPASELLLTVQAMDGEEAKLQREQASKILFELASSPRTPSPSAVSCTTLLQLGAMRTSRGGSGGRKTAVQLARLSGHEEFANALIAAEYVEPLKSELRRRLRRVMIIAYRFQQVFYVVSLRPGYSGFQRCRSTFEMNASIHDAS